MSLICGHRMTKAFQFTCHHALVGLLVLSGSMNLLLAHKVTAAKARSEFVVPVGTRVPSLTGFSARGAVSVGFPSNLPVLLYYFSPSCGWCRRNWDNVKVLSAAATGRFRLVLLSTVPSEDGALETLLPGLEIVWGADDEFKRAYRLGGTPGTVLVSPEGVVQRAWAGAFQGRVASEIEALFQVTLPGLSR